MKALSEREKQILNSVVESYVETAAPVGSRFLAKRYNLGISPATVRNTMNDLEEMGYLRQPHVSAGRVPTDSGYRFYVNSITIPTLDWEEQKFISNHLSDYEIDLPDLFEISSQILGKISSQLGVVLEPKLYQAIFQKMELVPISEKRIMAVISIKSGFVRTIILEVESELSREQLQRASLFINERLSGLTLEEIKKSIDRRLQEEKNNMLVELIIQSSNRIFKFEEPKNLHVCGAHNIMSNPEFSDRELAAKILEVIESKQEILSHFQQVDDETVTIKIGEENRVPHLKNCSIISVKYQVGNVYGTLGVVGPTRLRYAKIIALVDYMKKVLTQSLWARMS
jgi:heat-inducible transcriptional repressor